MSGFKTIPEEVQEEQRAAVAQSVERAPGTGEAAGSSPSGGSNFVEAGDRDPLTQEIEAMRDISLYLDALPPRGARRVLQFCISRTSERLDALDDLPELP